MQRLMHTVLGARRSRRLLRHRVVHHAETKYGHTDVPIFMLAKNGKIVADDGSLVRFAKADEHPDRHRQTVADTTVYTTTPVSTTRAVPRDLSPREHNRGRSDDRVDQGRSGFLPLAGFDGSYMRFSGQSRWNTASATRSLKRSPHPRSGTDVLRQEPGLNPAAAETVGALTRPTR